MMKHALVRSVLYVAVAAFTFGARPGLSQQSSTSDNPSSGNPRVNLDTRIQFSPPLPPSEAASHAYSAGVQSSLRAGLLRGQLGDFAGAVQELGHTLELQPDFAEAHYYLGLALLANSGPVPAWKDALAQFQAAATLRPDFAPARRMAGVGALELGDTGSAIAELKTALSLDPSSAEAHFDLGRAFAAAGDSGSAYSECTAALRLKSPYADADNALAAVLQSRQQYGPAVQHFNAALAAQPDLESAHYGLAKALKAEGKIEESKQELKAASLLLQRQSDSVMSSRLGNESLDRAKQGDTRAAMEAARKAIWLDPANALANFNLGLLLADEGDLAASIHQLRKAVSLAPYKTVFYLDLSRVQRKAGLHAAAVRTLQRAMQIDPSDARIKAALGQTVADNNPAQAGQSPEPDGQFAFGAPSDTGDGHFAFANQLSEKGDFLGAIGELRRALSLEPARGDLRYSLAVAAIQIKRDDEAEIELRNLLRLAPASVSVHLALGSLLFEQHDFSNAAAELRAVLQLDPKNQQAEKLLSECRPRPR